MTETREARNPVDAFQALIGRYEPINEMAWGVAGCESQGCEWPGGHPPVTPTIADGLVEFGSDLKRAAADVEEWCEQFGPASSGRERPRPTPPAPAPSPGPGARILERQSAMIRAAEQLAYIVRDLDALAWRPENVRPDPDDHPVALEDIARRVAEVSGRLREVVGSLDTPGEWDHPALGEALDAEALVLSIGAVALLTEQGIRGYNPRGQIPDELLASGGDYGSVVITLVGILRERFGDEREVLRRWAVGRETADVR